MLGDKFYKKDIKYKIKHRIESMDYLKGFMFAFYLLNAIKKDTLDELRNYLKEQEEKC